MTRRVKPQTVAIGAAVRVAAPSTPHAGKAHEGVVIEVAAIGCNPTELRACHDPYRDCLLRYVVQCTGFRRLCVARDMLVVAP